MSYPPSEKGAGGFVQSDVVQTSEIPLAPFACPSGYSKGGAPLPSTFLRRASNFFRSFGFGEFDPAQRSYEIVKPNDAISGILVDELAQRFEPSLFNTNPERTLDPRVRHFDTRYEVLPPSQENPNYSFIYYFGFRGERHPIALVRFFYDSIRPMLWGSSNDWEAVRVDVDPKSLKPNFIEFETSKYDRYNDCKPDDLHLLCQIQPIDDKEALHTVFRKDGTQEQKEIPNPFLSPSLPIACTSWNGSFDILSGALPEDAYKMEAKFLDDDTFSKEGFDLRTQWLNDRKSGVNTR